MIITHASADKIETIETNKFGLRKGCLFFAGEGNTYNLAGECNFQLNIEVDEDNIIESRRFFYDHEASEVSEILELMSIELDVDDQEACDLLDETENGVGRFDSEQLWIIQQYQGLVAHKLGYDACESFDEQGQVFIKFMG